MEDPEYQHINNGHSSGDVGTDMMRKGAEEGDPWGRCSWWQVGK